MRALAASIAVLLTVGLVLPKPLHAEDRPSVRVLAAGSLRAAFGEIGEAFLAAEKIRVEPSFGPSGVLRERIERGEAADLFASADLAQPMALAQAGKAGPVVLFARNRLCVLVRPGLTLSSAGLLAAMLDPRLRLGTATPRADPAGDYAWAMFAKADSVKPGSGAILKAKALPLMGGPNSAASPPGEDVFAWNLRTGRADLFLAYCSAGAAFRGRLAGGTVVALPPELATGADYGLTVLHPRTERGARLALFILSPPGQRILARAGFEAPLLPASGP